MNRQLTTLASAAMRSLSTPALAQLPAWVNQSLAAAQLPVVASATRNEGIVHSEVQSILGTLLHSSLPAYDATVIIDSTRSAWCTPAPRGGTHKLETIIVVLLILWLLGFFRHTRIPQIPNTGNAR